MDPISLKGCAEQIGGTEGFGKDIAGFIHTKRDEVAEWPYQRAEIYTSSTVIKVRNNILRISHNDIICFDVNVSAQNLGATHTHCFHHQLSKSLSSVQYLL